MFNNYCYCKLSTVCTGEKKFENRLIFSEDMESDSGTFWGTVYSVSVWERLKCKSPGESYPRKGRCGWSLLMARLWWKQVLCGV